MPTRCMALVRPSATWTHSRSPVTDRVGLEQISYLFPSRWGYAAGASTVDLTTLVFGSQDDPLWGHSAGIWILDIVMLIVITSLLALITWSRLRLKKSQA